MLGNRIDRFRWDGSALTFDHNLIKLRVFQNGIRNSFGMAFDPVSGDLWEQENGDDTFSELNRAEPGFNSGWVQMGGARPTLEGGHLFHFNLTGNRRKIGVDDPRLEDRVADNLAKFEITESESLLFGRNFGTVTDIQTGPDGRLYLVSIDHQKIYEIHRRDR